jgi:exosortase/archaeosortase family protein
MAYMAGLLRNKGTLFIVKFVVLFAVLYGFNVLFIGITTPGGMGYSPFLDQHLNYIAWWRNLILHSSSILGHAFSLNSYVEEPFLLKTPAGARVRMVYSCIGYGVTSFWLAFVLANDGRWRKKLTWCLGGITAIFVLNSFRVMLLLMAIQNHWAANRWMDHHAMFNIVVYILIFVMIFFYTRNSNDRMVAANSELIF